MVYYIILYVEVCQKRARVATRVDTGGKVQYLKDVTDQGSRREAISQHDGFDKRDAAAMLLE